MKQTIGFKLNGKQVTVAINGDESLLTVLREYLDKTGTKYSCGLGQCGACTVILNNQTTQSCITYSDAFENAEIITIEGLANNNELHPIQEAFIAYDALQCGFCTPGMIMNSYGLLLKNPNPSREEIISEMEVNLCRCGSYNRIVDAIESASEKMFKKI
ncbi:MAG: (2Fe-2S)-binding protein [Gelidibacter sp.]|nr:(2Fe-2S)-binding protein [Gelidibacter sp.]